MLNWNQELTIYHNYLRDNMASCHVTNNAVDLISNEEDDGTICVAEKPTCKAIKFGTLVLKIQALPPDMRMILDRVYYVKEFNICIISINQLSRKLYIVMLCDKFCKADFLRAGILKIQNEDDNLFYIKEMAMQTDNQILTYEKLINRVKIIKDNIWVIDEENVHVTGWISIDIIDVHNKHGDIADKFV